MICYSSLVNSHGNHEHLQPTADEILKRVQHLAQLRAIFMPPPPPPPPVRLNYEIKNAAKLPMRYLIPNHAAIQAEADSWTEGRPLPRVPGIRFFPTTEQPTTNEHA